MSVSSLSEYLDASEGEVITLLQFSAPWCERCPSFTRKVESLSSKYKFRWLHATLPDAEELQEHFQIRMLPAFVLGRGEAVQGASEQAVEKAVEEGCTPFLVLDDEF